MNKLLSILLTLFLCVVPLSSQVFFQGSLGPKSTTGANDDQTLYGYKGTIGGAFQVGYVIEDGNIFSLFYDYSKFTANGKMQVSVNLPGSQLPKYDDVNPITIHTIGISGETNFFSYSAFDLYAGYGLGLAIVKKDAKYYQGTESPIKNYEEVSSSGFAAYIGGGINYNITNQFVVFTELNYAYCQYDDYYGNSKKATYLPLKIGVKFFTNLTY